MLISFRFSHHCSLRGVALVVEGCGYSCCRSPHLLTLVGMNRLTAQPMTHAPISIDLTVGIRKMAMSAIATSLLGVAIYIAVIGSSIHRNIFCLDSPPLLMFAALLSLVRLSSFLGDILPSPVDTILPIFPPSLSGYTLCPFLHNETRHVVFSNSIYIPSLSLSIF